jgi:hypothetical protein
VESHLHENQTASDFFQRYNPVNYKEMPFSMQNGGNIVKNNSRMNIALSAAIAALTRAMNRLEHNASSEVEAVDARLLRECAAVIARSTTDEILSTMKGMKSIVEVNI